MKKLFTLTFALICSISMYAESGLSLYLVGDATVIGWEGDENMRQPCRMKEAQPGTYMWIGLLKHGGEGFKICNGGSWDGYHPSTQGLPISGNDSDDYTTDNGSDWKWNPENTDWQWYQITLLTATGKLSWYCWGDNPPSSIPVLEPVDGVISIGSAEELVSFANMLRNNVNGDSYNVKLTADIDYSNSIYKDGGFNALGVTEKMPFKGDFDGQGHTITVNFESHSTRFGLFGTVEGKVHDLKVAGKITATNKNQTGGICGLLKDGGKIYNCISAAEIVDAQGGDGTIGGICAVTYGSSTIENCAFYGKISAPNRDGNGGIVAWANAGVSCTIKNCLVVADITWNGGADFGRNNPTVVNTYKTTASDETLANGQMTYKLNGYVSGGTDWYQTLGTDVMPTPLSTSAKLYANGSFYCDGVTPKEGVEIVLSNTSGSTIDEHAYGENGVCTGCHAVGQEAALVDGKYQINNEGNLIWWSAYVNAGHTDVNAVLNADLDMTGIVYTPIGTPDNTYVGSFFGQNHSVTFALDNLPYNYQGLFGVVSDGVWIERVTVKGFIKGNNYVGGIVGGTNGGSENAKKTNIWHCGNEATITAATANGAGIIGVNMSGSASIILTNCYNTGNITSGREGGALSGWLGGGWSSVRNCYNSGTVKNGEDVSKAFGRNNGCYFTNCYYTATSGTDNSTENTQNGTPAQVSDAALASGELCVKLGEDFYQTLATDSYPVPNDSKPNVYEIAVSDAEYATFVPKKNIAVIPDGVTAYAAKKVEDWMNLEEVSELPADNAVIVKANEGSYYCNSTDETRTLGADNDLTFSDTEIDADGSQYVLAKVNDKVGFYKASTGKIAARKAYLESGAGVKAFYFAGEDDPTGINEVNAQWSMVNGQPIFNLAGQRLQKMRKGINIVNGKKILY